MWLGLTLTVDAQSVLEEVNQRLAADLVRVGDHHGAAIEYRRLSLHAEDADAGDGYRWLSAYHYLKQGSPDVALNVLDAAEQRSGQERWETDLLRAWAAEQVQHLGEEVFYLESVLDHEGLSGEEADYASRKLAAALIRDRQTDRARDVMTSSPRVDQTTVDALGRYVNGKDKSPFLGGCLGVIPGAGYAYAGEYANAFRSLILNSLFIYGMAQSADDEEWGAFSIITFFEMTWYTGSIYGGVDSSIRYNLKREQTLLDKVSAGVTMTADESMIPAVVLNFRF